jgi:hypothetical protein
MHLQAKVEISYYKTHSNIKELIIDDAEGAP